MNKRMLLVLTGLAIAGLGLITNGVELGDADQIASVIGALAALGGLWLSIWSWKQAPPDGKPGSGGRGDEGAKNVEKELSASDGLVDPPPTAVVEPRPAPRIAVPVMRSPASPAAGSRLDENPVADEDYDGMTQLQRDIALESARRLRQYPEGRFVIRKLDPEDSQ